MVELLTQGQYKLLETKAQTKILILGGVTYAWVNAIDIGEMLVTSHNPLATDTVLARGQYKLYDVEDEPNISDQQHLELAVGEDAWQGYLLPTGLPDDAKKRARVIPTKETISPMVG